MLKHLESVVSERYISYFIALLIGLLPTLVSICTVFGMTVESGSHWQTQSRERVIYMEGRVIEENFKIKTHQ